ncbi:CusA/CzcA family heavy metal efflux RND transporter, partial [Acinetobacter baumannii]|nr:CusA/CzcA family heavy metal efflux RND transporter [Acinetobacter baumannii]
GRPVAYVYVDVASSDAGRFLAAAEPLLDAALRLPPGYTVSWQGQYLQFRDGKLRLWGASLLTLALVAGLLQLHLKSGAKVALVLASLPFAATGGLWLTWLLGFQLSVAVVVGL